MVSDPLQARFPTARECSSWLLRSQPEERTALRTRQGPSPPGRKETDKCEVSILSYHTHTLLQCLFLHLVYLLLFI